MGLEDFPPRSPLVLGSKMADKFATLTELVAGLSFSEIEPLVNDRDREGRFFPGLPAEIRTRRALVFPVSSASDGATCGIKLDRRLVFSLRTGPMFDRRLPELLLADAIKLALPVDGARRFGDAGFRSRTFGICKFPSLELESSLAPTRFMFMSDKG